MAILNVNPTRMTLLNLKKQVKTAARGHKLLKDKRDGLMKHFMSMIREVKILRNEVEWEMWNVLKYYLFAASTMNPKIVDWTLFFSESNLEIDVKTKNVMSVQIPQFSFWKIWTLINYWMSQTSWDLDISLEKLEKLLPKLLNLAELEKSAESMAEEIERTRRRVNALEYTMLPNLRDTIKFITMKLWEQERASILTTMIVKWMIEKKEEELRKERMLEMA